MKNSRNIKTVLRCALVMLVATTVLGYAYYKTQDYLNGPQMIISYPQNGQTIHDPLLTIRGQTKNITDIMLNDRKIFIDKNGLFNEDILLYPGYNIIKIDAADKFKKNITKKIKIVYKEAS